MSAAFWILVVLVPAVAIAYGVWAYRNKAAAQKAESEKRFAALIAMPQGQRAAAGEVLKEQTASVAAVGKPVAAEAVRIAPPERFLSQPETLMYYLLKAALADHEVFPRVSVAAVIETPANAFPPEHAGRRPWQDNFDFVVCNKSMRVVAVIQLQGQATGPGVDIVQRRLNAAGIKMVRVDPSALPRREQVRALIFGQSA